MHKLMASAHKEFLLLIRDIGGIAILFIMPLVLIVTITLIQDSTFKTVADTKIPILVVNNDQGTVSETILEGLKDSNAFEVILENTEEAAKNLVFKGAYQLAIVIPENLSSGLEQKVAQNVDGIISKFGLEEETDSLTKIPVESKEVKLYFDPATQVSFKSSVKNGIDKMVSKIETQSIYKAFQEQITDDPTEVIFETENFITFKEILPKTNNKDIIPNSVQHNVPAWTLFAIFFIIVPLSINIVKEKSQGTFVRLRTNPVSYATVLGGKTLIYLTVCLIQFVLMLLVGLYVFPAIGLPTLDISGRLPLLFVVAIFAGLAAIGLGLLLGTIAKTQEQSAPFGATFVVILAALGGVWVPVFIMPKFMQTLSNISPMNWGLNAFYDVFLRHGSLLDILPEISLLFLFFIATTIIAIVYNEKKNTV
ncbi:MAG: ABC transporter [Xanthomarina sp.]|uniref:ABC transporter permease n=1 Tax=Xanthomarina gelatinilytica TaxID=1137281 RepID=A0A3D6BU36_9FLAO|nr:ABC transporter permease [Xanthomarina sp.]MAL21800.1 ABC transporter [Xanthomarina sp.]MBF62155.1 ABC transporter [Xanthomarina sp.]HCY82394.1 ABC transporter permease [Xanthomarina gelatinilytica]|tara:strand:- start:515 stop:1783 length:1269 start_codon:yes stop_codon:yes gene_type:complete